MKNKIFNCFGLRVRVRFQKAGKFCSMCSEERDS